MRILMSALVGALLGACGPVQAPADGPARVVAGSAVCRPTIGNRRVTGCYLTLVSSQNDRLVSAMSPMAREVEIHAMSTDGGVMRMRRLDDGLALAAGETVRLRPGDDHLMLIDTRGPLKAGDTVPLALSFEKAGPVALEATVGQPPLDAHGGH